MKKVPFYLVLSLVTLVTGCPRYKPAIDFKNPDSFRGKLNAHLAIEQRRYRCYRDGKDFDERAGDCAGAVSDGAARAREVRNELLINAVSFVDDAYRDFITDLTLRRDRANFVADLVELSTSAAVGITNGERALQILGIALTTFRGGRRSAEANFYKDQSTLILISKMNGNRARTLTQILGKRKREIDAYPIEEAIRDLVLYYNAGTLIEAFVQLNQDTGKQTDQLESELRDISITPEATREFRNLSVAAHRVLLSLLNDLMDPDPDKKKAATQKLKTIATDLEKDPVLAVVLKAAGVSSQEPDGDTLRKAILKVRTSAAEANNVDLLNKVNQAIVDNMQ